MRIREYGITVGQLPTGPLNKITDVHGVTVGHATVINEKHNTGVTVILPCGDNPFSRKLPAAVFVLNGFGKTMGTVQIEELGTLETPIALTNTLNVGLVHDAMVEYMVRRCREDGVEMHSVNPVVCECNDASLNDIAERAVGQKEVFAAIESAGKDFEEGAVGCGRGTTCHGLKGGVGSASRKVTVEGRTFTLGVMMQTNHGRLADLTLAGENVGRRIAEELNENKPDKGSCIAVLATDAPLSDRQLRRVVKRCSVGLARCGSFIGHGSGEVFVAFSTVNRIPKDQAFVSCEFLNDDELDPFFRAAAECTEEAVLNSLAEAETVTGYSGKIRRALSEFL